VADEYNVYPTYVQKELLSGLRGTAAGQALDGLDAERVGRAREKYFQWMSAAVGVDVRQCLLLDKNPSITFLIPPFRRLFPHATILMALRDPRDVVISCYLRHLPLNPVSAMFNQLDLTVMRCRAEWSAWLKLRQKLTARCWEIRYEHVVENADGAIARICAELGLDKRTGSTQDDSIRHESAAPDLVVRSPAYEQVAQPVHSRSVGRWRPYEKYLGRYLSELRPVLDALDYE
jgi:hypothetical protein